MYRKTQYPSGEHIKKEMGTCSTYREDERFILGFGVETYGKESTWKNKAKEGGKC
jgi:hypothetical protein